MKLLTSKSILECSTEQEENIHQEEINEIIHRINELPNYETALRYRKTSLSKYNETINIKRCFLYDIFDEIDDVDMKNGYDLAFEENGIFTLIVYGQHYQFNNEWYLVETHIDVLPYDEQRKFINIIPDIALMQILN